jgi:uncharacterized membrane protein
MFLKDFQLFPESAVLPLDDSPKDKKLYHIFLAITKKGRVAKNKSYLRVMKFKLESLIYIILEGVSLAISSLLYILIVR